MTKEILPSTNLQSFSCPHCHAIAHQNWYDLLANRLNDGDKRPFQVRPDIEEHLDTVSDEDLPDKDAVLKWAKREIAGEVFFNGTENPYKIPKVKNLHLSKCFSCNKISVWIAHKLIWPETTFIVFPSNDMPQTVRQYFIEASQVFKSSPRSAAALLRLAIEKLCNELNGSESNVFEGIGKLVEKGLDPKIQKALDIVRVTGNDAVHPGEINLNDTPKDAERLFKLVNLIIDNLVTMPNEIDDVYDGIPDSKRTAITKRDKKE